MSKPNDIAIDLNQVTKKFSSDNEEIIALSSLSATIKRNCITGLVGADGSGKTTLMRIIAGLLPLTQGQISVEGIDPMKDLSALRGIVGYMPQKFGLYEDLTVIENFKLYADLCGVTGQDYQTEFKQLMKFTNLGPFITRRAGNLSGGMKQKLGLACALLGNPKVLILDEPSVGVDPISRRELWKMVNELIYKGMTVVWSTSYLNEAELCENVLVLNQGQLIYSGSPKELMAKMEGCSIQVQNLQQSPRLVLQNAMRLDEVIDGVIQGSYVRLVLKEKNKLPKLQALEAGEGAKFVTVYPRFEDVYMSLLGGIPKSDFFLSSNIQAIKISDQSEIVIEAKDLTKKFDSFVATNKISFKVKRGEIFCLLGPNGAGKSTTFKMMCGLLMPNSGSASILNYDLRKNPHRARQQLGYMAQKFSLYGDLTVQQNLKFFSGIYGLTGKKQTQATDDMIESFNLKPYLQKKAHELPLGFKQRLSLACAIMHKPAILFLDEPTSGVDAIARREFWMRINELVGNGVTVVVTTHFMEEAEYCDRLVMIYRGQVIACDTPDELKQHIRTPENLNPTMEEVFFALIEKFDEDNKSRQSEKEKLGETYETQTQYNLGGMQLFQPPAWLRRLTALCQKEFWQIVRDPSSVLIAFILPLILLFIYGFGINLDTSKIRLGMLMNDHSPEAWRFMQSYADSPYIETLPMTDSLKASEELTAGNIRGIVLIQSDFTKRLIGHDGIAPVQVITDGTDPNTANYVINYATGAWKTWLDVRSLEKANSLFNSINVEPRYWYNPAAISRNFLVPGSIALVMTIIGALLTSLVVAREWERGTMEALLSTRMTRLEFLFSKLIPYYILGIAAMLVCLITAVTILATPFRGSIILLFIVSSLFLGCVLGLGLFLSTVIRNQFKAAWTALNLAYLPAVMLSGFVFEISSMPPLIQGLTYLFPARYFVSSLQTLFLAGNIGYVLILNSFFLLITSVIFLFLTYKKTRQYLD